MGVQEPCAARGFFYLLRGAIGKEEVHKDKGVYTMRIGF